MKLDMDLCRQILLAVEEKGDPAGHWIEDLGIDGYESNEISAHVQLLDDGGLIEAIDLSSASSFEWKAKRLTMEGHEFIDHVQDQRIWSRVKNIASKDTQSLTVDILKDLVKRVIARIIGL